MKWVPGELTERIAFYRKTAGADDGMGGKPITKTLLATVSAKVISKSGREALRADRINAETAYLFVIRKRSDILPSDVIVWRGVTFNISNISDEGPRPLYLEISADRGVAQ